MTEIYRANGLSIQVYNVTRADLVNASNRTIDQTLVRAGAYLGCSATLDTVNTFVAGLIRVCNTDDSELTYGQALTTLRIVIRNSTGSNQFVGAKVIVFMGVSQ